MIFLRSVFLIFLTVFWSTCSFEMKSGFLSFIGKPQSISSVAMMVQNFNRAQHRILITVNIFYAFTRSHIAENGSSTLNSVEINTLQCFEVCQQVFRNSW